MKELEVLKSNRFILWVAIFTVIFLAPNSYFVYWTLSVFTSPYREIASAGVAIILAGSIMIYTVRKNIEVAQYLAYFEVMIAAYYYISTIGIDWPLIPGLGFAMILPYTLSQYAKEIDIDVDKRELLKFMDNNPKATPEDFFKAQKNKK
jgi:hypothetical protein